MVIVAVFIHIIYLFLSYIDLQVFCIGTYAHEVLARLALIISYKKALIELNTSRSLQSL